MPTRHPRYRRNIDTHTNVDGHTVTDDVGSRRRWTLTLILVSAWVAAALATTGVFLFGNDAISGRASEAFTTLAVIGVAAFVFIDWDRILDGR